MPAAGFSARGWTLPGWQHHTMVTNFKEELSLYDIEPFILMRMNMMRRGALLAGSVLDDEQPIICVSS
jgi:hypothetical protein